MYTSLMADMVGANVDPFGTISLCARHGITGVDLRLDRFEQIFAEAGTVERFRAELSKYHLRPGYVSILPGKINVDQPEWDKGMSRLPRLARLARDLGYTRSAAVVLSGHDLADFKQQWEMHVSRVRAAMDVQSEYGIALGLEYVAPLTRRAPFKHKFIHDMRGLLDLIDAIDRPSVGLLFDSFHWHCAEESVDDILALKREQVVVVHVSDLIPDRPVEQQVVGERLLPGESGIIDHGGLLSALRTIGYDGPVTCEPTNPMWNTMDPDAAVARTAAALHRYLP